MKEAEEQAEAEYQQKKLERKRRRRRRLRRLHKKKDSEEEAIENKAPVTPYGMVPKNQLKDFLSEEVGEGKREGKRSNGGEDDDEEEEEEEGIGSKPIADLFPAGMTVFPSRRRIVSSDG